jgi:molecular chaperone DnaK
VKVRMPGEGGEAISDELAENVAAQLGLSAEAVRGLAAQTVTAVAPRGFGIELQDMADPKLERTYVQHLLHANDALPRTVEKTVYTVRHHQVSVNVAVWEQAGTVESQAMDDNTKIGHGRIVDLPPLAKGSPLEVTFELDDVGSLRVHAIEPTSRREVRIQLEIAGMDAEQVRAARDLVAGYQVSE